MRTVSSPRSGWVILRHGAFPGSSKIKWTGTKMRTGPPIALHSKQRRDISIERVSKLRIDNFSCPVDCARQPTE